MKMNAAGPVSALLTLFAISFSGVGRRPVSADLLEVGSTDSTLECTGECEPCAFWTATELHLVPLGHDGTHQDEPYSCAAVPCPNECVALLPDGSTTNPAQLADRLEKAVREGEIAELELLLRSSPSLVLNVDRELVQLLGCGGAVFAQFPISRDAAIEIAE